MVKVISQERIVNSSKGVADRQTDSSINYGAGS